jgi:hypothetical protein
VRYDSGHDAGRRLGLYPSAISACANERQSQTGGYEFKYAPLDEPAILEGEEWRDITPEMLEAIKWM